MPAATTRCATYEEMLDGVHRQELCYNPMWKLTSRLRTLVFKNEWAGPANTPTHVEDRESQ